MSPLDDALNRFEQALARLEAAVAARRGDPEMALRLALLQAENARLRAAAGDIAARVDGALARVNEALTERE